MKTQGDKLAVSSFVAILNGFVRMEYNYFKRHKKHLTKN